MRECSERYPEPDHNPTPNLTLTLTYALPAQRYLAALPSSDAAASLPPVALHIALPQLMFALATNT